VDHRAVKGNEMQDKPDAFPVDDQWDLLVSGGFSEWFAGTWVDDDSEEVARRLRVDPVTRLDCDLSTAMRWYQPYVSEAEQIVWVGAHAPGWTHIIGICGTPYIWPGPLSEGGRRMFHLEYDEHIEGVHGLDYWRDGKGVGQYGQHTNEVGELDALLDSHGIDIDSVEDDADEINAYLRLVGRITGRFIDQDWLAATRTLYRIPGGAWD
jgi:hypothetical protein